jgi:hypothetical protein
MILKLEKWDETNTSDDPKASLEIYNKNRKLIEREEKEIEEVNTYFKEIKDY